MLSNFVQYIPMLVNASLRLQMTDTFHMSCELKQHILNFHILKGAVPDNLFVWLMADSLKCSFN